MRHAPSFRQQTPYYYLSYCFVLSILNDVYGEAALARPLAHGMRAQ
jgi:hypothetical protein